MQLSQLYYGISNITYTIPKAILRHIHFSGAAVEMGLGENVREQQQRPPTPKVGANGAD
jgi:hypothetical protein